MATERQRQVVLGVLVVVLAVVLYREVTSPEIASTGGASPATSTSSSSSSNGKARPPRSARGAESTATAPDVHLRSLDRERPKPIAGDRNLFRFRPKPPPPAPPPPPPPVVREIPSVPSGPPPPPPIPLKFIGIVEAPTQAKRIAALIDPMGRSFQGREGEIVAGQYRILKIGVESIEMAYLDGRGRQTIRLSGS
jgi:hypothetical protein